MRFRADQHLRRRAEILAVREEGQRLDCRAYTLWWRVRPGAGAASRPRMAVAAPAATVGPAVRRNRAKRRLREIFRRRQDLLPPGCDVFFVARAATHRRPFAELERNFVAACGRMASPEQKA